VTSHRAKDALRATRQLVSALRSFIRDSPPEQQRQRYNDIEFDWQLRVDTPARRLAGVNGCLEFFTLRYQPTESALFHERLTSPLREQTHIDFHNFIFIDLGSGKGRTLFMASEYPFQRIIRCRASARVASGRSGQIAEVFRAGLNLRIGPKGGRG
jgi:hypothetical protein